MAEIARKTQRYPSDLTDEEWERMAPLMPKPGSTWTPSFRNVFWFKRLRGRAWLLASHGMVRAE